MPWSAGSFSDKGTFDTSPQWVTFSCEIGRTIPAVAGFSLCAAGACGDHSQPGTLCLRLLRDRPGLLCHRLSVPAPLLSDQRSHHLHSSRRCPGYCLCALLLTGGAVRERLLRRADLTSARSSAASLRAHSASASAPVGGRKLQRNFNGEYQNEKIPLRNPGGPRHVLHGHGERSLQVHRLWRPMLPLRLRCRLLLS